MRHLMLNLPCGTRFRSPVQVGKKERKKEKRKLTAEHIFSYLFFFPRPALQPLKLSPAKRLDLSHLQFHVLRTNWSPQERTNTAQRLRTRGKMCSRCRGAAEPGELRCHCGLEQTARFTTCSSVAGAGGGGTGYAACWGRGSRCLFSASLGPQR